MSLAPEKAPAGLDHRAPLIDVFCKACYWIIGAFALVWLAAMMFAIVG